MISFNSLGNLGRLGNQMFQFAALKGIARHREFDFCVPSPNIAGQIDLNVRSSDSTIYNTFQLRDVRYRVSDYPVQRESTFNFDKDLFNNCQDNVDLFGYFQNENYFKHIEDEIRKDFTFKQETLKTCKEFLNNQEFISLHVRRGDYIQNSNHPIQPLDYYEKALTFFDNSLPVMIFSDDYRWCQVQELFSSDRFFISENNTTEIDLCLQSLCTHHIISNSSFSWWGSYLANSKKTVSPKLWFSGENLDKDTSGIHRENWIVI